MGDPERRWSRVAAVVLLLALVVGALVWNARRGERALTVPTTGGVAAAFLDGQPVFVVHHADGGVQVLDAASPHDPFPKVLAWCEPARAFEDLWHGSIFRANGSYIGGPAPTGMASYEILSRDGGSVRVGDRGPAPSRGEEPGADARVGGTDLGQRCDVRTALYGRGNAADPAVLDDLVVHGPPPGGSGRWWLPTAERILGQAPAAPDGVGTAGDASAR